MIEKVEEADMNHVHQGKVSCTARETIRNIVFIAGKSKGLTDGNNGRVTI